MPISGDNPALTGSYNLWLVFASVLVAMLASYTALDMTARVTASESRPARWGLLGGSTAMGIGIWSMHFLGMLAFRLPIPMGYDPAITLLSLFIGMASSAFALWTVWRKHLSTLGLSVSAILMGFGIAAMHYTGMAAMRMKPGIQYDPTLLALSIVIAIVASGAALWIAFRLRGFSSSNVLARVGAAVLMGLAIAGMHYTGMAAARFPKNSICSMAHDGFAAGELALMIIVLAIAVLSVAVLASRHDFRLESRIAVLASSLADANQELQFLALHDSLTKLPNRALLVDRLEQEIQNAKRQSTRFSVLFIDLDGFKQINDAFGLFSGDRLLIEVALRVRSILRARDTLARMGSDEFVVLANTAEPSDAARLADKLVAEVGRPFLIDGIELRVSASIGIAMFDSAEGQQQDLLKSADAAMYHAKALGRNRYCFFDASMNDDAQRQMQVLHDLRVALERKELVLHYQPKFDAHSGRIVGAEALVRWKHAERGLVPPDQFIPLAEKTGLIVPIGEWVLDEACRQMREWQSAGYRNWSIAVNLSAVQFNHPGLIQMVRDTLERHGVEPRCLTLEVTESTAMHDTQASMAILRQLDGMGVRISIDDFGTGYSSLLYLKRLPASELKIDRGFVCDIGQDADDAAIISAIVALGRTLNLKIVAEGVETIEQQEFLTRLGCSALQGFLLGRPMAADHFLNTVIASGAAAPLRSTRREVLLTA
jgi:diguanylate cyclase